MPRPERLLFPDSDPLHAFAARLRDMRRDAGNPTYGAMARKTGRSRTALAEAAGGDHLPQWDSVVAYVSACGGDPDSLLVEWEKLRDLRALPSAGRAMLAEASPGLTNLRRVPTPHFIGREEALDRLDRAMRSGSVGAAIGPAVHGLGGVGKSEVALQYVHAHRREYSPIWWIAADTGDNVALDLAALTRSLEPAWPATASTADTASWATRWLGAHSGWLLVLDNVIDPAVVEPVLAAAADRGRIIVTSRRDIDWRSLGLEPLPLPVLDRGSSVDLLVNRTGRERERDEAALVAELVGDLPLALGQVAAYLIERPHIAMVEYRRRFRDQPRRILAAPDRARPTAGPIFGTWQVSIAEIARQDPLAASLLDIIAYLHPDRIPVAMLAVAGADPLAVEDALVVAASFTVITRTGAAVTMHRLVQAAIRDTHDGSDTCRRAVELLIAAVPPGEPETDVSTWPAWSELAPHIEAIDRVLRGDERLAADGELAAMAGVLLARGGLYLRGQGRYPSATAMLEHAMRLTEGALGPDAPQTILVLSVLAGTLWSVGRFEEGVRKGEAVWTTRRRLLGPEHPDTLWAASYVGIAYREMGRHDEALALSLETLDARTRVLGADHPDTLQSRNNVAGCYKAVGRHDEALPLYESTAADRVRVLGPNHFDTLQSLHNLAGGYLVAGRLSQAVDLYRSTLDRRRAILGPDHPDTLHSQHNLAEACRLSGLQEEADELMRKTLSARTRLFGPNHPDTRRSGAFFDGGHSTAETGTNGTRG